MNLLPTPSQLDSTGKHIAKATTLENAVVMNIQLKAGQEVAEHHSSKDVLIVVRKGSVLFTVEGVEVLVTQDNMLQMSPNEKHSLRAVEDVDILVMQITP